SEKFPLRMSRPQAATERRLIEIIRRAARRAPGVRVGIGDDCAVLEPAAGSLLLATTDLLIEDVHFRRRWATPTDIGWKSLAVNVSDIAAMGGRPRWGLIALACPEAVTVEEAEAFYTGVQALATEHDVAIVGGDTSSSPRGWGVNVTLLGEAVRAPIVRATARVVDVIAATGSRGRSAARLARLEANPAPAGVGGDAPAQLTAAPDAFDRLAGGLVRATGTKLTAVGRMMRAAEGIQYLDAEGHAVSVRPGFEHFVTGRARA